MERVPGKGEKGRMKKSLRILHLEDDPLAAELISARLESDGVPCEMLRVDTREAFTEEISKGGYDLILADYSLPGFDGMSALTIALDKRPDVPYIFISGQMGEDIAVEAMKRGATDYVLKGGLSRLVPAVKRALREAEDRAERKKAEDERARLEAQLQHAQKLESLGLLAGGIAHDFNNLLTAIMGQADLALSKLPPDAPGKEHVEMVARTAESATALTHQMLAYTGRAKYVKGPVDINSFVHGVAEMLKVSVSKKALLEYDFTRDRVYADADVAQLQQVVMNLITNASDAIGDNGGTVRLTTGVTRVDRKFILNHELSADIREGEYASITVSDTGIGMDAATRKKIFDPFFTTKFTGRGLGLSAVLGIVRGHNGGIVVESEPGRGTKFTALLPRVEAPAESKAASPANPAPFCIENAGGTVLVVDDEESVRVVTRKILENCGYKVLEAGDGVEGVDAFKTNADAIDVVMLDMTMPRMGGAEAFEKIRDIRRDTPVIISSGFAEEDISTQYQEQGMAYFIQKPYNAKKLLAKIAQAFHERPARDKQI